ncbi:MAG TPA: hypothetical protein VK819_01315 [Acidobacteriaceae bacterium]|jgi:hypothetical protein|nr:hypothetical protein [Acidobacteriaceae bacterium]
MKQPILEKLESFKSRLQLLKRELNALTSAQVNRIGIRTLADEVATMWVEDLRSPLEHKIKLSPDVIEETSADMKRLHVLSRPSNLKTSYLEVINNTLKKFDDKFVLPIKQIATEVESIFDLQKLVPNLPDPKESAYLKEAVECAAAGHRRAAIVMGWCAVVDKFQKKIAEVGFDKFNTTSRALKAQTSGKYRRWNKEFNVSTHAELQTVFDSDLVVVLEGMGLLDGNEAERLEMCFTYRNQSAHPSEAPIADPNVVAFFSDITAIVLANAKFSV